MCQRAAGFCLSAPKLLISSRRLKVLEKLTRLLFKLHHLSSITRIWLASSFKAHSELLSHKNASRTSCTSSPRLGSHHTKAPNSLSRWLWFRRSARNFSGRLLRRLKGIRLHSWQLLQSMGLLVWDHSWVTRMKFLSFPISRFDLIHSGLWSVVNWCILYARFSGAEAAFCGAGCQPKYGTCATSPITSPDGTCGGNQGYVCSTGNCCSQFGFWYAEIMRKMSPVGRVEWLMSLTVELCPHSAALGVRKHSESATRTDAPIGLWGQLVEWCPKHDKLASSMETELRMTIISDDSLWRLYAL